MARNSASSERGAAASSSASNPNRTYNPRPGEIDKKWILIDAKDLVVGRLATIIAMRLRGKHLPTYTPNMDMGDNVIVINADKVKLTGKKLDQRRFYWHTGHPGGIKDRTQRELLEGRFPERVLENAVRRMIPEGPLGRKQYGNLRVYAGETHPHEAQSPERIDVGSFSPKNVRVGGLIRRPYSGHTLGRVEGSSLPNLRPQLRPLSPPRELQPNLDTLAARLTDLKAALDLPDDEDRRIALKELSSIFPELDIERSIAHPAMLSVMRGMPDRLMDALAENLMSSTTAKAAAVALAACVQPQNYGRTAAMGNERQVLEDLEELFVQCRIDSFSTARIKQSQPTTAVVEAQLWNGLPFTLDKRRPRLANSRWLKEGGQLGVKLEGAQAKTIHPVHSLADGQLGAVRIELTQTRKRGDDPVVVYLTYNDRIFDQYVYETDELFAEAS